MTTRTANYLDTVIMQDCADGVYVTFQRRHGYKARVISVEHAVALDNRLANELGWITGINNYGHSYYERAVK
jgi:hypothetical protein